MTTTIRRDIDINKRVKLNGTFLEHGSSYFTGVETEAPIPVLAHWKIDNLAVLPKTALVEGEYLYSALSLDKTGANKLTLNRGVKTQRISSSDLEDCLASNDVVNAAIGFVPVAGTITSVRVYNKDIAGGDPIINLGTNRCYKASLTYDHTGGASEQLITGSAADFDDLAEGDTVHVSGTNITAGHCTVATVATDGSTISVTGLTATGDNSDAVVTTRTTIISDTEDIEMPADASSKVVSAVTDFVDNAFPAVRAGDLIIFNTTGGTTSDPTGMLVEIEITPTLTSGLTFSYLMTGY